MTWDVFTRAIKKAELDNGTQAQILILLFRNAGYINKKEEGIAESTAKKWISGTRKCKVSSYFPEGVLGNPEGIYNFFRRRPEDKLKKLQQIFCDEKDANNPIDYETEDMDRFCWSLVNQFLDLLELQRLDIPVLNTPQTSGCIDNNKVAVNSNKSNDNTAENTGGDSRGISDTVEKICATSENDVSGNASAEQNLVTLQKKDMHPQNQQGINMEAEIAFPQDCKICFCCKNWDGNVGVMKDIADEYGECKAFGKSVLSTEGVDCIKFKASSGKIMQYEFYKKHGYPYSKI